jgi:hypothetical protein
MHQRKSSDFNTQQKNGGFIYFFQVNMTAVLICNRNKNPSKMKHAAVKKRKLGMCHILNTGRFKNYIRQSGSVLKLSVLLLRLQAGFIK